MIYPTTFKSRRPDPIALGLRKAFAPVTDMTEPFETALKRLIVLDFAPALDGTADDAFGCLAATAAPVWTPTRQSVPA